VRWGSGGGAGWRDKEGEEQVAKCNFIWAPLVV
jgi:hypothetical protein